MKKTVRAQNVIIHIIMIFGSIWMLFPLLWVFSTSFKTLEEAIAVPPTILPAQPTLNNYYVVLFESSFVRFFLNSILVAAVSTLLVLLTSSLAGFIFAKYKFWGKSLLFLLIVATTSIPFETYMSPLYLIFRDLGLVDTYSGLIAPLAISSFGIFFMRQNILSMPDELLDAAKIDGCSDFRVYSNVILPLSRSPMAALGIYNFMFAWGFFIWPLILINSERKLTLEVGLAMYAQRKMMDYGAVMAGAAFSILPSLIVFLILRERFVEGMTLTGFK